MKNSKKIKLGKLNFYIIEDNYIKYLSQFDKHIAYNKNEKQRFDKILKIIYNVITSDFIILFTLYLSRSFASVLSA